MIFELSKDEFHKCKSIINENGSVEVKAVVSGVNPGRIFVDHPNFPSTGLIWLGNNDGFYFIGDENNDAFNHELNSYIDSVIIKEAKKVELAWFEGIGNHPQWNKTIERIFKHRKLGSWNQRVYTINIEDFREKIDPEIEKEYTVFMINKSLFENDSIKNNDYLYSKILETWPSLDAFFSKGVGMCIIHQQEIVSVCISSFVFENIHCIDIETINNHQGKKLAQKVAYRYVKECFERGIIPYWDVMETNKPSITVAEHIGFTKDFQYVGYEFTL
ncbi:GNAT family N-acetyltransferase [Ornithinibacillus sp. L9]|uniref:GNAT family N-acetyltransferase n=1 Tax=Ornithinibacillus caprae TaxID=2678566 RepID=A0A6N8FM75_9BACI|nr:GNAT family N-acetyltransferase [Ornithinibacillus caprae]MUK89494.1 GNAT family N-acetyltransferase [Ornithinibacillus caprae]